VFSPRNTEIPIVAPWHVACGTSRAASYRTVASKHRSTKVAPITSLTYQTARACKQRNRPCIRVYACMLFARKLRNLASMFLLVENRGSPLARACAVVALMSAAARAVTHVHPSGRTRARAHVRVSFVRETRSQWSRRRSPAGTREARLSCRRAGAREREVCVCVLLGMHALHLYAVQARSLARAVVERPFEGQGSRLSPSADVYATRPLPFTTFTVRAYVTVVDPAVRARARTRADRGAIFRRALLKRTKQTGSSRHRRNRRDARYARFRPRMIGKANRREKAR